MKEDMFHRYLQFFLFGLYLLIATGLMVKEGIGITPDRYLVVLLVGVFVVLHKTHRSLQFIHDFAPFVFILVAYDFLRGFADNINLHIHYFPQIYVTKFLFSGHMPTVDLQRNFYTPGFLHWYDYSASILYLLHFAIPFAFAFSLWFYNRRHFREFMLGLCLVSYGALIAYLVYPTAPPWLASTLGYTPPITKILNVVMVSFPEIVKLPTTYSWIGPNLVASVPSLHGGYAFLVFLFALRFFGAWGFLFLPYVLIMWITIVYLGEHYFIDIVVGVIYDLIAFGLSGIIMEKFRKYIDIL